MSRVYVASSWRNAHYEIVRDLLRDNGHSVADWKSGPKALPAWSKVDERYAKACDGGAWTPALAREALRSQAVLDTCDRDLSLLWSADALVLLTPCGRSAHLEAGVALGRRMPTAILLTPGVEPEVMTARFDALTSTQELLEWLQSVPSAGAGR